MKKTKHLLTWAPELVLIAEAIFYWLSSSLLNPIPIVFILLLIFLLIYKHQTLAFIIAILFIVFNLYMSLALYSDLVKVSPWTDKATRMLLIVGTMLGTGLIAATAMLIKWIKNISEPVQASN